MSRKRNSNGHILFLAPCASAWFIDCLYHVPVAEDEEETYAPCLKAWADAFPADQLFVLQVGEPWGSASHQVLLACPVPSPFALLAGHAQANWRRYARGRPWRATPALVLTAGHAVAVPLPT